MNLGNIGFIIYCITGGIMALTLITLPLMAILKDYKEWLETHEEE